MKIVIINYGAGNIQSIKFAIQRIGFEAILSDDVNEILAADKVIFPGVGEASSAMQKLKASGLHQLIPKLKKPVLGICLGHQAIGVYFGAVLCQAEKPMHGKVSFMKHKQDLIFKNVTERFEAVRYHSLIIKNLPPTLQEICLTDENVVMGIKHTDLPIYGIQFHPESILTNSGLKILENWLKLNNIKG